MKKSQNYLDLTMYNFSSMNNNGDRKWYPLYLLSNVYYIIFPKLPSIVPLGWKQNYYKDSSKAFPLLGSPFQ